MDHARIDVPGTYNFREVAVPVPGGRLRPGRLYRSDALSRLPRAGRAALVRLSVRRVVDLRSGIDRRIGGRDRLRGTGAELVRIPMLAGAVPRDTAVLDLRDIYRTVLTSHGPEVAAALRAVADADGPVVLHCTAGKDRTGLVVALALLALGASEQDVVADYTATGQHLAGEWSERTLRRLRLLRVPVTEALVAVVTGCPAEVLLDTLRWVEEEHGGVHGYLESVGFDSADLGRLRGALVA